MNSFSSVKPILHDSEVLHMNHSFTVPDELKQKPQWVLWKLIKKDGEAKATKIPFSGKTQKACDPTCPTSWMSFSDAISILEANPGAYSGLGFCLSEEVEIICIDLDHSLNEDGQIYPWAKAIIDRLPASYTEISQSNKGFIFSIGESFLGKEIK